MTAGLTVALPIEDRRTSFDFYSDGLGLEAFGEPGSDGLPEPLQFEVAGGVRLMLVPRAGFGWVIGDREVAPRGPAECLLGIERGSEDEVDAAVDRAREAGAEVVSAPSQKPWGYEGVFADPDGHLWMVARS
jgi:predicted lactoylglutathione lyase